MIKDPKRDHELIRFYNPTLCKTGNINGHIVRDENQQKE